MVADHHQHLGAGGIELGDDVGALVHCPDIVMAVDPHRMGEHEAVEVLADFPDELAGLVKLPEPGVGPAVEGKDVALGIGGDALQLAKIVAGRDVMEKSGHGLIGQIRGGGISRGRDLRIGRHRAEQQRKSSRRRQICLHVRPPQ